ncbi:DUF2637 domain-containing protein [Catenulispora sp. NL8]|uniref:DUF2637 domain-containing protein n=1 Tax=Catenulispora pinistramenti TaxID=2705254 RepID=A0ABS5KRZ0_9ACTN|nr:DUF2637 domain-containing protein [Catenulispora pinistramenti]MBS2548816.1 DUF2637 domain-containing protein [Catenulispora pinistramenti]
MQDHGTALPELPRSVVNIVRIGLPTALIAAELLSFPNLHSLAQIAGWNTLLAWLLPVALDVYMTVSAEVWQHLPETHPISKTAGRNARFALALTEGGNALNHLATTHGGPSHLTLVLAVSGLPPLVVARLMRLASFLPKKAPAVVADQKDDVEPDAETAEQPIVKEKPTPKRVRPATGKRAAIIEYYNADQTNGMRTSSTVIAEATGATSSYVRRLYRELDTAYMSV